MGLIKKKSKDLSSLEALISDFASKPIRIITILFTMFMVLFPLYWLISSAFKYPQDYLAFPPVIFPTRFTLENFVEIIQRDKVFEIMFNSLYVATFTTIVSVIIGSMAAYALQRGILHDKVRGILGLWFLVQKMYPAIATAIPIYLVMRYLKLMDTKLALIIMNTSFNLPLVIWLMMGFFKQIPYSLEESAMIDGCNFYKRFFVIILPITKPGLIASAILVFVATWNEFLFAVILSIRRAKTLPVLIAGFITDRGLSWGPMAATTVLTLFWVVLLVWIVQKDFKEGLAMGSVKG